MDVCPKGLIQKSDVIGTTGQNVVEFKDENNQCLACASCAMVCPDIAITEVYRG